MGKIKILTVFLLFFGIGYMCSAQQFQGYFVEKTGGYTLQELTKAMDKAELDHYRKFNSDVKLIFDNGAVIRLNSAASLITNGIPCKTISLVPEGAPDDLQRRFSILPNGMLSVLYPVKTGK